MSTVYDLMNSNSFHVHGPSVKADTLHCDSPGFGIRSKEQTSTNSKSDTEDEAKCISESEF